VLIDPDTTQGLGELYKYIGYYSVYNGTGSYLEENKVKADKPLMRFSVAGRR